LSLLGVYNINDLTECSKVLPPILVGTFLNPDQLLLDLFLNGPRNTAASDALQDGDLLPVL
jgi:manganese peroxidase